MDLSQTQIDANRENFAKVADNTDVFNQPLKVPTWVCGDSLHIDEAIEGDEFDMLLTCPPYFDLEQYSDDPADISNMNYGDFLAAYETIFAKSVAKVKDNGFIAVVVGEVRDEDGNYRNLIGDTINAIEKAGAHYYNEIVLITMLGTLPIRIRRQFEAGRKVGNTHQKSIDILKEQRRHRRVEGIPRRLHGNKDTHTDEEEHTRLSQREGSQKERIRDIRV